MACDICGKNSELFRAVVEEVELNVCIDCSAYGKVLGKKQEQIEFIKPKSSYKIEEAEIITDEFASIIKNARESLGMTQKEFAARINEKESFIHKMETGSIELSIPLARKLEKLLKIKLVEKYTESGKIISNEKSEGMTLGDFIKIKKK